MSSRSDRLDGCTSALVSLITRQQQMIAHRRLDLAARVAMAAGEVARERARLTGEALAVTVVDLREPVLLVEAA